MAAVAALFGLVGLWKYVVDTKRIALATDATLRASTEPVLEVYRLPDDNINFSALISNLGNGPALGIHCWELSELEDTLNFRTFRERRNEFATP